MTTQDRQHKIYKTTIIGSVANVLLMVFKFVAGFVGHSSAMVADAVHSLSDFVTDIIVLIFVKISGKPSDGDHQYGHGKYETLATAIIGLLLMGVGIGMLISGAQKIAFVLNGGHLEAPGMLALIAAVVSIVVKEGLYQYTIRVGKKVKSQALIANAWHHRSDAFSSIATLIGIGGAILLGSNWHVLDPIAAIAVSALVIKASLDLLIPSVNELLEKSLPKENEEKIKEIINSFPGVHDPHNLRTRRIGPVASIEVHVRMDADLTVRESHAETRNIEKAIREYLGPDTLINIHVEPLEKKA